jgi:hypothetical protein
VKSIKSEIREILLLNENLGKSLGIKKIVVRQIPWYDTVRVNDANDICLHQWEWDSEARDRYCEACQTWQEEIVEDSRWNAFLAKNRQEVAK